MTKDDVIRHFGSQSAVAAALGIKPPSVAEWGEHPPPLRQLQIEALTRGALVASPECRPGMGDVVVNPADPTAAVA